MRAYHFLFSVYIISISVQPCIRPISEESLCNDIVNPCSAGIDFIRQILTFKVADVYKVDSITKPIKIFLYTHNISSQMKRKELTKPFMMISICK